MIKTAVDRPVAVIMIFIGLVLMGVLGLQRLPVDLLPTINYPNLTVITNYADTPADDLTRLVTQPLEEVIAGLAGVRRVVSRTREGVSTITVQYDWGTDMDFANLHLREAIDRVSYREDFPTDADRPLILRWDPSSRPIAILVLGGGGPLSQMTDFARDVIKPALEQSAGVSQAEIIGGSEREILVCPDFEKLRLYGITMEEIGRALQIANVSFPGGRIRRGPLHLPLRILGEFENLEEIRQTEIPSARADVKIGDVAEVIDTTKEPEGMTLLGSEEVVSLHLYKEVGANTIQVTEEVDRILKLLIEQYPDFKYEFVYRDADFVKESFQGVRDSLLYGAFLAFLVLLFFLQEWRSPVVVSLAIPVSVFATFACLYFAKVNLNLMSLGGLSLAAGMLVDNSIVVLENINRHLHERFMLGKANPGGGEAGGSAPAGADSAVPEICASATKEMASPVMASTLTNIAVFFPVIYVPGIAGEFFRDQALTVTISLIISIFAALLLQPMLSARFLPSRPVEPKGFFRLSNACVEAMARTYRRGLVWAMDHKGVILGSVLAAVLLATWVGIEMRKSLLPERNRGDFTLGVELPAGTPLEDTERTASGLCDFLVGLDAVETVYAQVGETEKTLAALKEYSAANTARLRVLLKPSRHSVERMEEVKRELTQRLTRLPGVAYVFRDEGTGLGEVLASGEAEFTLGVVAERPETALTLAETLMGQLKDVRGLRDLAMDRVLGNPTVEVRIDRELALRYGLEPDQLGRELRARIQGVVATTYNEVEQRIDIAVRLPLSERRNLDEVLASPVAVASGRTVPMGTFVLQSESRPVREIVRRNQRRQISITADVFGRRLSDVWDEARDLIATLKLPEGVNLVIGGEQEEVNRSFKDLGWALVLSVLLIYMILAAQFESFLDPLIISAVLPVGVMGALLSLFVSGNSINIMSLIGLIALIGIAVNNAIVQVSTIQRLRADGMPGREAVMEACRLRLRPILMTTLTTILALLPMAIGIGTGEQIERPLAITLIGGLSVSTFLTLFQTPIIYEVLHRLTDRGYDRAPGAKGSGA
jgi:HAE1 family hydrophobic/amphiphilic exporter-1